MHEVTVLGATGSIGTNTLDVIARHPEQYRVFALTAHQQLDKLLELCRQFSPRFAVVATAVAAHDLQQRLSAAAIDCEVLHGQEGLCQVASAADVQTVVAAIVGAAGLRPTMAAVQAGKKILLANKEALVMSGALLMQAVREHGAQLLPIDSEHNAIYQCLPSHYADGLQRVGVRRLLLTASGGPFREASLADLQAVTPEQACAHPNWAMGKKISVDSASMMNKGLELIEACWLFDAKPSQVEVVIHPQSIVHSLVDYVDGSVLAQLGNPDMRTPIAHALAWPERIDSGVAPLDLCALARMDFYEPDMEKFVCLRLARAAAEQCGTAPAVLNAANEVAVAGFLDGQIGFLQIAQLIEEVMQRSQFGAASSLDAVIEADQRARILAQQWLAQA